MSHWFSLHWYGECNPPASPVLSINGDGDTATVTGSDIGSDNILYVLTDTRVTGSHTWTLEGNRTGDGTIPVTLDSGYYWAYVHSVTDSGGTTSNLYRFKIGSPVQSLSHSPADVIARLLIDLNLGILPVIPIDEDWPIHIGSEPNKPDNVITVYDTTSQYDGRSQISGQRYQHYGIQIRVRGKSHVIGYPKAQAICVALDQDVYQNTIVIGGNTYVIHSVTRTSEVLSLGKEVPASQRNIYTINLLTCITLIE